MGSRVPARRSCPSLTRAEATLSVDDLAFESDGNGLAVWGDDPSTLIMNFTQAVTNLALAFGNDDPNFSQPGDVAVLQGYLGGVLQGLTVIALNRDDIMNQTIGLRTTDRQGGVLLRPTCTEC